MTNLFYVVAHLMQMNFESFWSKIGNIQVILRNPSFGQKKILVHLTARP